LLRGASWQREGRQQAAFILLMLLVSSPMVQCSQDTHCIPFDRRQIFSLFAFASCSDWRLPSHRHTIPSDPL